MSSGIECLVENAVDLLMLQNLHLEKLLSALIKLEILILIVGRRKWWGWDANTSQVQDIQVLQC